MFDLVFLFTGLSVFALHPPTNPAERLDVVLVAEADHQSMLVVSKAQVVSTTNLPPPAEYQPDGTTTTHLGYSLKGRKVRVLGQSGQVTWFGRAGEGGCPLESDRHSYEWVIPFSRLVPGNGQILPGMRHPSPALPPSQVDAKIELEAGVLTTAGFARNKNVGEFGDRVLLWRLRGDKVIETAAADLVELRQKDLTENVILELAKIDGSSVGQLSLKANGQRAILVEVFNQPEEVICCQPPDQLLTGAVNTHFCHHFNVLPPDARCTDPIAVDHCPEIEPDVSYGGRCIHKCDQVSSNPQCPGGDGTSP